MLLTRIITATVLATLIALAVFELPVEYFSLSIALITLLGAGNGRNWLALQRYIKGYSS